MANLIDTLSGTTAADRQRLCAWWARMTDAQRMVVAGQQKELMRRRRTAQGLADLDTFAYAMQVLALNQLRNANESFGRKRSLSDEQLSLIEKLRLAGVRGRKPKKRGGGEKAEEFIRANYLWLAPLMEQQSLDMVIEHIRVAYRKRFARSTFYQAWKRIAGSMQDWEESDNVMVEALQP